MGTGSRELGDLVQTGVQIHKGSFDKENTLWFEIRLLRLKDKSR